MSQPGLDPAAGAPRPRQAPLRVDAWEGHATDVEADTVALGLHEGDESGLPEFLRETLAPAEANSSFESVTVAHAGGRRWLLVGLGDRAELSPERVRMAAAFAQKRAAEIRTRSLAWQLTDCDSVLASALVDGTVLARWRFDRFKAPETNPPADLERLIVCANQPVAEAVREAAIIAEAVNGMRELQETPPNLLSPTALAAYALAVAADVENLTVETDGREEIIAKRMGSFAAVAQGSDEGPALVTLRYEPPRVSGPRLGLVGKGVTFDSGGISLKPASDMWELKFDMTAGAAVIQAIAAIARLQMPVSVVGVVGAAENLPSGHAMRPGDIVTAMNGTTIEVLNTDAEGRMVLADCLCYAASLGAERLVDIATLTFSIVVALGPVHGGLMSNNDEWAARVLSAGATTGEIVWRLPLHADYARMIAGRYADIHNQPDELRRAGSIVAGKFLEQFVDGVPWARAARSPGREPGSYLASPPRLAVASEHRRSVLAPYIRATSRARRRRLPATPKPTIRSRLFAPSGRG